MKGLRIAALGISLVSYAMIVGCVKAPKAKIAEEAREAT
jgi:hypothetical protein